MRLAAAVLLIVLPGRLRRLVARRLLGWDVHPSAHIGRSLVLADKVTLGPAASIGSFNLVHGLAEVRLGTGASIATHNRITAPLHAGQVLSDPRRKAALILGDYAMITVGHEIDCTDRVELRPFAALAGFRSQVLTHSLDLVRDRWVNRPVVIGEHSAVMSGCILQNGIEVPARSIISAGSVVTTKLVQECGFYRGNPAQLVRVLPADLKYFTRTAARPGSAGG